MKESLLSIFRATKGSLSSKRVFGGIGMLVVLICYIDSQFSGRAMPSFTSEILAASTVLLGADTVTKIFNRDGDN